MLQTPPNLQIHLIGMLTNLRKEWQDAAGSSSLLSTQESVGLILADLVNGLSLPVEVQIEILGAHLFQEIQNKLDDSSQG